MGIYLNPGNKGFWESIRSKIYVDKTGMIACTNGETYKEHLNRYELIFLTLDGYRGEILLVGINYDRDNKNKLHSCVIEKTEKR